MQRLLLLRSKAEEPGVMSCFAGIPPWGEPLDPPHFLNLR